MEEAEAIARLKRNDISGLEALVHRYQVQAVRVAALITRDRGLAEDIVQSAFIRAHERIAQFDDSRPFGPWFLRSVVNDALKSVTRGRREIGLESDILDALGPAGFRPESALDPVELAEGAETRRAVREALDKLPPEQRAAIVMRYYLELSEADMADQLGCARGTVKWRLHAARARLRRLLHRLQTTDGSGFGGVAASTSRLMPLSGERGQ